MPEMQNLEKCNVELYKTMKDKLFFTSILPQDKEYRFFDYGCGDGELLLNLRKIYGNKCQYTGYDTDPIMIRKAREKDCDSYYSESVGCMSYISTVRNKVLILSSVIHEILTENQSLIDLFWDRVQEVNWDYIIVRDMMYSEESCQPLYDLMPEEFEKLKELDKYNEFENIFGKITTKKDLIHFLLKVKYDGDDWNRELKENYFPISSQEFLNKMKDKYRLIHYEQFQLPFMTKYWKEQFNITLLEPTHVKCIFKNKRLL